MTILLQGQAIDNGAPVLTPVGALKNSCLDVHRIERARILRIDTQLPQSDTSVADLEGPPTLTPLRALEHVRRAHAMVETGFTACVDCGRSLRVEGQHRNIPNGVTGNAGLNGPEDSDGVPACGPIGALVHTGPICAYIQGRRRLRINRKISNNDGG